MKYGNVVVRKLADRTDGERLRRAILPANRVTVDENGVAMVDPADLQHILWNPATGPNEHEPWPLAGVEVVEAPKASKIPTSFVAKGITEGWAELENPRIVFRSGGPPEEPWRPGTSHTFTHADAIVIHAVDGPVRYRVVKDGQPDKWPDRKEGDAGFGGEVRWFYDARKEDAA